MSIQIHDYKLNSQSSGRRLDFTFQDLFCHQKIKSFALGDTLLKCLASRSSAHRGAQNKESNVRPNMTRTRTSSLIGCGRAVLRGVPGSSPTEVYFFQFPGSSSLCSPMKLHQRPACASSHEYSNSTFIGCASFFRGGCTSSRKLFY